METRAERLKLWTDTVQAELQDLIIKATQIREKMNTAKTRTKVEYYGKKFKKISSEVVNLAGTIQKIEELSKQKTEVHPDVSELLEPLNDQQA